MPSFVVRRCETLFGLEAEDVDPLECRSWAPGPAFELAAAAKQPGALAPQLAARRWFSELGGGAALEKLETAAALGRGSLSRRAVRALYGERPRLSASRIDRLAGCGKSRAHRALPGNWQQFGPIGMDCYTMVTHL